ncbi:hypothetical protein PJL18_02368 [Paenarthrobacter nicotinovorans]|nr:hypothetical protein [Paenarthrobacter nicotinovorans]
MAGSVVNERFEYRLFRDETCQRRNTGHGCGGNRCNHAQGAGRAEDAGELADVARSGLVVDDAHYQEQRSLEQAVRQQQPQSGQRGVGPAQPHHHGQETELADGAVSKDEFDVGLPQRAVAANKHGGQTKSQHHRQPEFRGSKARSEPRDDVDTGLHHGRRMQVGADRRRSRHRAGEPEVERDECGFGDGTHQDQYDGGGHGALHGAAHERPGLVQNGGNAVSACGLAHDDQAYEHRQATSGGDHQRLKG